MSFKTHPLELSQALSSCSSAFHEALHPPCHLFSLRPLMAPCSRGASAGARVHAAYVPHARRTWHSEVFSPQSCPALCNPMGCSRPGLPVLHYLPEFAQTHVHRVGDAIQPSHPLSSPSPPAFILSQHRGLLRWVSSHQVAKLLEFQLQHQSSNEYSGLISFRMDLFDIAVQGTLKSPLQHHSLKASIFQCSAFFMVHLSTWLLEKDTQRLIPAKFKQHSGDYDLIHLSTGFCCLSLFLMVQESGNSSGTAIWKLFIWFQDQF